MNESTTIVLVRHGESQAQLDQVVAGIGGCRSLSDRGRRQVEALCQRLATSGELGAVDALDASTLPRATETGAMLSRALGGVAVRARHELREWDPGPADGITWTDHAEQFGTEPRDETAFWERAPGAETWAGFGARVAGALLRLAHEHRGETVVVACHGGVIEHSFLAFHDRPITGRIGATFADNAAFTEWRGFPAGGGVQWQLRRHNDGAHAAGV